MTTTATYVRELLACRHPKDCVAKNIRLTLVLERCGCCGSERRSDLASGSQTGWERPLYVQRVAESVQPRKRAKR